MIRPSNTNHRHVELIHATLSAGPAGEPDFSALVVKTGPMVGPLRDPAYFARVFLEDGAPTWPNSFDMDPEWLRREIDAAGALTRVVAEWLGEERVLRIRFGIGMNTGHTVVPGQRIFRSP